MGATLQMEPQNPQMPEGHTFGQPGVLYLLATAEQPLTAKEMYEMAPVIDNRTIANTCFSLYQKGLLVRRLRGPDSAGAKRPYEYTLRARDNIPYINE